MKMNFDGFGDYLLQRMYPGQPEGQPAPAPAGQQQGDILVAEVGSRGLPERAYTGVNPDMIKEIDPTVRQRVADFLQAGFEGMGVDRYTARKNAQTIMGGESSNFPIGVGIADFVSYIGSALQAEDLVNIGKESVENAQQGNYGTAAIQGVAGVGGAALGAPSTIKATKAISKKIKSAIGTKE